MAKSEKRKAKSEKRNGEKRNFCERAIYSHLFLISFVCSFTHEMLFFLVFVIALHFGFAKRYLAISQSTKVPSISP